MGTGIQGVQSRGVGQIAYGRLIQTNLDSITLLEDEGTRQNLVSTDNGSWLSQNGRALQFTQRILSNTERGGLVKSSSVFLYSQIDLSV